MTDERVVVRCPWCGDDPDYVRYHDREWGVPVRDDRRLFEMLVLEGAQAGLSWLTILKRQAGYRRAFDNFDIHAVARYSQRKIESLLGDSGIIRNRLKVESAVTNARCALDIIAARGSLHAFLWDFVDGRPIVNRCRTMCDVPATTPISDTMSRELRRRGFRFVGSTICYAFMQSVGMINDHLMSCYRYAEIKQAASLPDVHVSNKP